MAQSFPKGIAHIASKIDVQGNQRDRRKDDEKKRPHFGRKRFLGASAQKQVVRVKIHGKEQHKHRDNYLQMGRVVHAVGRYRKSTRSCRSKGRCNCFKNRHSAHEQDNKLYHRHHGVDSVENKRRLAHLRHELGYDGPRALRLHHVHILRARQGQERDDEHQHPHAAHPVGEATPHQKGFRHLVDFCTRKDACARGREARRRFKKRVDIACRTRQAKGQRAEQAHHNPRERNDGKAFLCIHMRILRFF